MHQQPTHTVREGLPVSVTPAFSRLVPPVLDGAVAVNEAVGMPALPEVETNESELKNLKLTFAINAVEGATVVSCHGRIVFREEAVALTEAVLQILPVTRQLVLELSDVEMIDNFGLGELLLILRSARAGNISMSLAAPSAQVSEMLHLTRLDTVFEIHSSVGDALSALV
jgi:anti-anti-sigma factor